MLARSRSRSDRLDFNPPRRPDPSGPAKEVSEPVTASVSTAASDPIADTTYGQIHGSVENSILTFKGVRYGADTSTTRSVMVSQPN